MFSPLEETKLTGKQTVQLSPKPIRILSIDGGGLRGIVAVKFLQWIESVAKRPIYDCFDVFAGTSTGGLIVSALTFRDKSGSTAPRYTTGDLEEIYRSHGKTIFPIRHPILRPYHSVRGFWWPRFSERGLHQVLQKYFGRHRLADCGKPVFITSYDIDRYNPVYFTSRFINRSSHGYNKNGNANPELVNICRATSAAPTYLPSFSFVYADGSTQNYPVNCVDGGVYVNNPALAAYIEVASHLKDPIYSTGYDNKAEDIFVLSIGTGQTIKSLGRNERRGTVAWIRPVVELMMQGNSQAVNGQMTAILDYRYCRLDLEIEEQYANFTDARSSTYRYLCDTFEANFVNNSHAHQEFKTFSRFAQI